MLYIYTVAYLANKDVTALRLAHLLKSTVPVPNMLCRGVVHNLTRPDGAIKRKLRLFYNKLTTTLFSINWQLAMVSETLNYER